MQDLDRVYREQAVQLRASLAARIGDVGLAEEAVHDAFAEALEHWPAHGVPPNPGGWLATTARRKAIDRLRRARVGEAKLVLLTASDSPEEPDDDLLGLVFACCHPALPPDGRAAMMLRFVAGLSTAEIARLFLVSEPTMSARLTRAKRKMALAGIPLRTPDAADLPERIGVVLKVVYLLFTEGYRATAGEQLTRPRLCAEAIRLGYLLGELLPGDDRIPALLALMLFQHARRDARVNPDGGLVTLPDQDREHWHFDEIARGVDLLAHVHSVSEYGLQARIAAEHATTSDTDWPKIAGLYAELERLAPSPVVRLNRAVAVAEAGSPEAALHLLDGLEAGLPASHLLPAVRGELLLRLGRRADAAASFSAAVQIARTDAERQHLRQRLAHLD